MNSNAHINRRKYPRLPITNRFVAHNNVNIFQGQFHDISVMGFSFYSQNTVLSVGSHFVVHVRPGNGLSAFNALCEVVSRKGVTLNDSKTLAVKYNIKFLKISKKNQDEISSLISNNKSRNIA